jgi:hypothetical protein
MLLTLAAAMLSPPPATRTPSRGQLATAITQMTQKRVRPSNLRAIACKPMAEEPTEFACRWQQRSAAGTRWRGYSSVLAIDVEGWSLIDLPGASR